MLSFWLTLFNSADDVLIETPMSQQEFLETGGGRFSREVSHQTCTTMASAELQVWYHDNDVDPVLLRTLWGERDDYDEDPYINDLVFFSTDDNNEFHFEPKLLTYFSFHLSTHLQGTRILLMLDHDGSMTMGEYGDLSYFVCSDVVEVDAEDILSLLRLESGVGTEEDVLKFYVPWKSFIHFFMCVVRAKRWAKRRRNITSCKRLVRTVLAHHNITEQGLFDMIVDSGVAFQILK